MTSFLVKLMKLLKWPIFVFLFVTFATTLVFFFPGLLINTSIMQTLLTQIDPQHSFHQLNLQIKSQGWFDRQVVANVEEFNGNFWGYKIKIGHLELDAKISTKPKQPEINEVSKLTLNSIALLLPDKNIEVSKNSSFELNPALYTKILSPLKSTRLGAIRISDFKIIPNKSSAFSLETSVFDSGTSNRNAIAKFLISNHGKKETEIGLHLKPDWKSHELEIEAKIDLVNFHFFINSTHKLTNSLPSGKIDINFKNSEKIFSETKGVGCNYQFKHQEASSLPSFYLSCKGDQHLDLKASIDLRKKLQQSEVKAGIILKNPVKFLSNISSKIEIPAPFNALKGQIDCSFSFKSLGEFTTSLPFTCKNRLDDGDQFFLHSTVKSKVTLNRKFQPSAIDLDLDLDKVAIVLPNIDPYAPEIGMSEDSRIVLSEDLSPKATSEKIEKQSVIATNVNINSSQPILVKSNLLNEPLPIYLNLKSANSNLSGGISIKNHELSLVKRKIILESVKISFDKNSEIPKLSGSVRFASKIYMIRLVLDGTVKEPIFYFTSEPALSDEEIIAYILFGSHPEYLEQEDLRSVSNTQAALANSAVSLISMYYLTSTPVERVGFDPATNYLSAQISPIEGVSISVGTIQDTQNDITLRKYLGNGWSIETKYLQSVRQNSGKAIGLLRWGKRY